MTGDGTLHRHTREDVSFRNELTQAREMSETAERDRLRRNSLLARMAGNIASGFEANPTADNWKPEDVAKRAVAVARAILDEIDGPPTTD